MQVYVVIPSFNEEKMIGQVLKDLSVLAYQIVVVDDASSDRTIEIAQQFPVTILRHRINRDQGAALQTGNQYALSQGADIIVHFDADGQFLVSEIKDVIDPIVRGECDMVFGSRFLAKKSDIPGFKKNIILPIARLVNLFLGIKTTDPQSGFRAMSREAAKKIQIEQDGKAHCSEILSKAFVYKLRVKEVPMTVIYHEFGQTMGGGWKIIKDLLFSKLIK
jgi:polyprenyl-phospho-N-acetylgalactosaminyl synthase